MNGRSYNLGTRVAEERDARDSGLRVPLEERTTCCVGGVGEIFQRQGLQAEFRLLEEPRHDVVNWKREFTR